MSNRQYRLIYGALILIALYFEQLMIIHILIGVTALEAITNFRVPKVVSNLLNKNQENPLEGSLGINFKMRTNFEAERGWRFLVATLLFISIFIFPEELWYLPWFMGLAIFGAGISGVCPMFLMMKWFGLK